MIRTDQDARSLRNPSLLEGRFLRRASNSREY